MTQNVNEDKALRDSIEELSGSTCGEFRLLDCLGYGTHTAVYSSIDGGGGTWAVKLIDSAIDSDEALLARIQHDADRLAIMDDPTILPIGHSGQSGRYTYGGTRLVDGRPLSELMLAGSVGSDAAWHLLCELAEALERSFERGLICRVIKPSNILVDGDGRPHLTEFGLAGQLVGPMALSSPGYRLGFPQYLAPEQVNGQLGDERTDVYAVATLVFELLTETPLFDGSNPGEVLRAVKLTPPPSAHSRNAALPPAVDRVLSQALAKDPLSRPRSVSELLDQLMNLPEPASTGTNSAAMSIDTAAAVLNRMGVPQINFNGTPVLNSYLSFLLRQARLVAAEHWSDVLTAAGLQHYCEQLPPDDGERVVGAETVGALADGFSRVFGADSQEYLRQLGIKSTQEWMEATQRRPFRMMGRSSTQVADVLMLFTSSMDRVRGESLHLWKPIDDQQFWIIHYANLGVFGRSQPTSPCTFWLGTYQAALEWGGLAGKWTVAEEECGAATGSGNCVFKLSQI